MVRGALPALFIDAADRSQADGCRCGNTTFRPLHGSYSTALNVVDTANPENSLILRKPTSSSESEGVADSVTLAHGGGVRFTKDSVEYATILGWIKGEKD